MEKLRTMDDVPLDGKAVIVRVDFNVPIGKDGEVGAHQDYRIEAALSTIRELQQRRCKVLLLMHLGRPGEGDGATDVAPIRRRLEDLLREDVLYLPELHGRQVDVMVRAMEAGSVAIFPNVRLDDREMQASDRMGQEIAAVAGAYVNEAFSVCHRAHTSMTVLPRLLPSAAGRRLVAELEALESLLGEVDRPYVAIASGAKIDTKVGMLRNLLEQVDTLCLGGQISNVFLAAQGMWIGHPFSEDEVQTAKSLWDTYAPKICLPVDVWLGSKAGEETQVVAVSEIPESVPGLWDIGPQSTRNVLQVCETAKTIMWNGPMGMFEVPAYAKSTQALVEGLGKMDSYRVVGGGDTVTALETYRMTDNFTHVSVGGGAMLAYLEGKRMPGLEPLYG